MTHCRTLTRPTNDKSILGSTLTPNEPHLSMINILLLGLTNIHNIITTVIRNPWNVVVLNLQNILEHTER